MKVTVCAMRDGEAEFKEDWDGLLAHVKEQKSDLVLLPEVPFAPWPMWTDNVDQSVWLASVEAHDVWIGRLEEFAPAVVLGTKAVIANGENHNDGFVWDVEKGSRFAHRKYYLPNEPGFWEATWYRRGDKSFEAIDSGEAKVGFQICTELWFTEHSRNYAKQGVHIIAAPRATELSSADKWLAGGRAAAVMSGAYCLSSNRIGTDINGLEWGGHAWVIDPDGEVLGVTTEAEPFLTVEIDLAKAEAAKQGYPRDILE
ncbi:MAG: carbon-nitrogen hydrolase family protein [Chloroflexi bacterium]|nr:carbon-nitrogen hydrolase family protein [Chloroflexota bacterium]